MSATEFVELASCERCVFFKRNGDAKWSALGECRRLSPRVVYTDEGVDTFWPGVFPRDWCGEFSQTSRPPEGKRPEVARKLHGEHK